jgi:hypothetical protein
MASADVVGLYDSEGTARASAAALKAQGLAEGRVAVSASLTADPTAAEAPGQSYENQPGERESGPWTRVEPELDDVTDEEGRSARYAEALRGSSATVRVQAASGDEARRLAKLMRGTGAREVWRQG